MKSDRKPPIAKSPMRLRARRSLKPSITTTPLRTPFGSISKTQMKKPETRSVCRTITNELNEMIKDNLGSMTTNCTADGSHCRNNAVSMGLFERGRFYDAYSARRDERLRKKQRETMMIDEPKTAYSLRVKAESTKKKRCESSKKPTAVTISGVDRSQVSRYGLRSMSKKPPLPMPITAVRKTAGSRSTRK